MEKQTDKAIGNQSETGCCKTKERTGKEYKDLLNRLNRRSLHKKNTALTDSIAMEDYSLQKVDDRCFDLFYIARK